MAKKTINYRDALIDSLQDPEEAVSYLNAALEEDSCEAFLLALRNVAESLGFSNISRKSNLSRESMYRMLSGKGNPKFSTLSALLRSLNLKLSVRVKE
ncbi:addiction module antidote protein [Candidatus Magnetominusculus dajiuhuensis]|uniref:addiction module antidote protein n=1 Tax=Candidatus Magnetominusculus dajiuhuensis TaxID=3137712 RepID=UPI0019E88AC2|nr:putative addiction module antidote protein [Nitrospirota bacterium]